VHPSQRPKLDRYPSHLFLTAYATRLDTAMGELAASELAAFITRQALITVRKDDGLDIGAVLERWFQRESGLRHLRRHHRPGRAGALPHLQAQGLAMSR